jgi:hypothetical protein
MATLAVPGGKLWGEIEAHGCRASASTMTNGGGVRWGKGKLPSVLAGRERDDGVRAWLAFKTDGRGR